MSALDSPGRLRVVAAGDDPAVREFYQMSFTRMGHEVSVCSCGPDLPALCADWWPDGPRLKPLNQVQNCIAGAIGRKL